MSTTATTRMHMDDVSAWLKLIRVPGMHAEALDALRARFGSIEAIVQADAHALREAEVSDTRVDQLTESDPRLLDADLKWLSGERCHLVTLDSPYYPPLLRELRHAPIGLFVFGAVNVLHTAQLAIVGARNPTAIGRETADAFAAHLAECGLAITSGLAAGIDAAAHRGALRVGGTTLAVCATGLDQVYPRDHRKLAAAIAERGALVSEFPPQTPPLKFHFPRRNRLISGLCLGTLVVEAALHSGSLITARFAADQGREVFAIPGSIHNPLACGCHQLLRNGAKLVESAADILAELGPLAATLGVPAAAPAAALPAKSGPPLDKEYKILLDALGFAPASVDQLVARTGLRAEEVASMLLILELEGRIEASPGALYSLASAAVP